MVHENYSSPDEKTPATATPVESSPIDKAQLFILNHHDESLSLKAVARAIHLSSFYFCRRFKQETGFRFTAYVARVRVERVQVTLLQPQTTVTEAAFAAGFQSLSQFNRVFRQITGESPTGYRARLGVRKPASSVNQSRPATLDATARSPIHAVHRPKIERPFAIFLRFAQNENH